MEIVRVGGNDELTVEMVGSVRRDIETKRGEGVLFVGVGVCYIGFRLEHLFFSHRNCTTTLFAVCAAAGFAGSFYYKRQNSLTHTSNFYF